MDSITMLLIVIICIADYYFFLLTDQSFEQNTFIGFIAATLQYLWSILNIHTLIAMAMEVLHT